MRQNGKAITIFSVLARIVSHYNYLLYVFRFIETKIRVSTLNCVFGVLARTGSGSDYNISVLAHIVSHYNYLLYVFRFIETKMRANTLKGVFGALPCTASGSDYNI